MTLAGRPATTVGVAAAEAEVIAEDPTVEIVLSSRAAGFLSSEVEAGCDGATVSDADETDDLACSSLVVAAVVAAIGAGLLGFGARLEASRSEVRDGTPLLTLLIV
jgi:hypothetical protein